MAFDWRTGDKEGDWEQGAPAVKADGAHFRKRGWRWLLALGLLLMAGAAGFFLWRRSQNQVRETTAVVTADVLSSYDLAQRAASTGDEELLVTVLSGRDPQWTSAQRRMLRRELLFGRAARVFGLEPLSSPAVESVRLSPDLREARLLATQRYSVAAGRGLTQTVILSQTLVFRRGPQRWFYSPPDQAFWDALATVREERLVLTYPGRDRNVAVALAVELDQALEQMCASGWVTCPPGRVATVRLATDAASVLRLWETDATLTAGKESVLPAPSLVGVPAGEVAYQALFRGYASHVLATTAGELLDYRCCRKALFHQALLDRLLNDLGVRPWPVAPDDYVRFAANPVPMGRIDDFWRAPGIGRPPSAHERLQARAFVTFLESVYGVEPAEQHRLLLEAEGFWGWMREMSGVAVGREEAIGEAWRRFLENPPPEDLNFRHNVALQNRLGVPTQWLTGDEVQEMVPRMNADDVTVLSRNAMSSDPTVARRPGRGDRRGPRSPALDRPAGTVPIPFPDGRR